MHSTSICTWKGKEIQTSLHYLTEADQPVHVFIHPHTCTHFLTFMRVKGQNVCAFLNTEGESCFSINQAGTCRYRSTFFKKKFHSFDEFRLQLQTDKTSHYFENFIWRWLS